MSGIDETRAAPFSSPDWVPEHPWAPAPPPRSGRRRSVARIAAVGLGSAAVVAAGVGIGHGLWPQSSGPGQSLSIGRSTPGASANGGASGANGSASGANGGATGLQPSSGSASGVASKVDPGLVDINTVIDNGEAEAAGTGMVLTSSGEVLTNNHVIDGATSISVTDVANAKTYSATVVGYDRSADVAVLQLTGASGLQTVSIGNSATVSVGQSVVGIGNAGGTGGTPSAAAGTVVALDQSITATDSLDGSSEQLTGLIETNADIQPGDSGGPLVDSSGQVVGIDTAGSSGSGFAFEQSNGDGYAIPINEAIAIAKQIVAGDGSATVHIGATAFLGVDVEPSGSGAFGFGGLGATSASGAAVAGVVPGDPAQQAGLSAGDVITALGSTTITSPDDLANALAADHPGQTVQLQWVDQSGQQQSASVQLASGPPA